MRRWRWTRRPTRPLDETGPATGYAGQRGGYARGAAPSERPEQQLGGRWPEQEPSRQRPAWNEPTVIDGYPLLTYGQRHGYRRFDRVGQRPAVRR